MKYTLRIDEAAERDLDIIHDYLLQNAGPRAAHRLLDQLLARAESLMQHPLRGALVTEMTAMGPNSFRQVHSPPWRIIYSVQASEVVIVVIADGRRDIGTLLTERSLAAPMA